MQVRTAAPLIYLTSLACAVSSNHFIDKIDCQSVLEQEEPVRIVVTDCRSELLDEPATYRFYSFEDEQFSLDAVSTDYAPSRAELYADGRLSKNRGLTEAELTSSLLQTALDFLRDCGVTEVEVLTPDKVLSPDFYYDTLPPPSRPAA